MKKVRIVTYTHWDRELRREPERTRMRPVDLFEIRQGQNLHR